MAARMQAHDDHGGQRAGDDPDPADAGLERPAMNRSAHSVPQHSRADDPKGAGDRRVRRTTRALIEALVALVLEKRYDAITIQDLLDRADVGRSTFYAHYRGKDDL